MKGRDHFSDLVQIKGYFDLKETGSEEVDLIHLAQNGA
jgi:hypothetical protein